MSEKRTMMAVGPRRVGAMLVTAALVLGAVLALRSGWSDVRQIPAQIDPIRLGLAVGIQFLNALLGLGLWLSIVGSCAGREDRHRDLRIYALTTFARRLPGAIWQIVGRVYLYRQAGVERKSVVLASGIEAGVLVVTGTVIVLLLAPLAARWWPLNLAALPVLVLLALLGRRLLANRAQVVWTVLSLPRLVGWSLGYTVSWFLGSVVFYLVLLGVQPNADIAFTGLVGNVALAVLVGAVGVLVPGGAGLRELGLVVLVGQSVPPAVAVVAAICFRVVVLVAEVLCAAVTLVAARRFARNGRATPDLSPSISR